MEVQVNFIGVIVAVVASMIIGGIWYSMPVFGKTWMMLEKIDEGKMKNNMYNGMIGMLVYSLVMAFVLAHVTYLSFNFYEADYTFLTAALSTSFWMWLGFVVPVTASNSLFNQKPWKLTFIHMFNWLFTLMGMGLAIGLIGL